MYVITTSEQILQKTENIKTLFCVGVEVLKKKNYKTKLDFFSTILSGND